MSRFIRPLLFIGCWYLGAFGAWPVVHGQDTSIISQVRSTIQPFVDDGILAGAVTLVGTPDHLLSVQAFVGWMSKPSNRCEPMRCSGLHLNRNRLLARL